MGRLVQPEDAVRGAEVRRLDQLLVGDDDLEQRSLQLGLPEGQEALQRRELGKEVVILPDVGLQQPFVVRTPVKDLRGGQPIADDLLLKVRRNLSNHGVLLIRRRLSGSRPSHYKLNR